MKPRAAVVAVILVILLATAVWVDRSLRGECRQLLAGPVRIIGDVRPVSRRVTYMILETKPGESLTTLPELRLGAHRLRLASMTKQDLEAAGFRAGSVAPDGSQAFSVRFGPDRTDAGINLMYADNAVRGVSIICRPGDSCDFSLVWDENHELSLPASEAVVRRAVPMPLMLRGCEDWGF